MYKPKWCGGRCGSVGGPHEHEGTLYWTTCITGYPCILLPTSFRIPDETRIVESLENVFRFSFLAIHTGSTYNWISPGSTKLIQYPQVWMIDNYNVICIIVSLSVSSVINPLESSTNNSRSYILGILLFEWSSISIKRGILLASRSIYLCYTDKCNNNCSCIQYTHSQTPQFRIVSCESRKTLQGKYNWKLSSSFVLQQKRRWCWL